MTHYQVFTQVTQKLTYTQNLHVSVYSTFIHNQKSWEQSRSSSQRDHKQTVGRTYCGILLSNKKEGNHWLTKQEG